MPIRFRCKSCNQLLGIARRKTGTWVSCPTCRSNVLVPAADEPDPAPPSPASPAGLFDRDDFEMIMAGGNGPAPVSMPPLAGGAVATPPPLGRPAPPLPSMSISDPAPAGLVLSPGRATLLTVVLILLLATSFVAGLLVGRFAL